MKTLTNSELIVLAAAEAESGVQGLTMEAKLSEIFKDSLEFASFIVALKEEGLTDEAATSAETLGDLAGAITLPN